MTEAEQIPDGTYFLHPDGGCCVRATFSRGEMVGYAEEALQATHDAAGDRNAGMWPEEDDAEVGGDLAILIIREIMPDASPELVHVTTRNAPGPGA